MIAATLGQDAPIRSAAWSSAVSCQCLSLREHIGGQQDNPSGWIGHNLARDDVGLTIPDLTSIHTPYTLSYQTQFLGCAELPSLVAEAFDRGHLRVVLVSLS